MRRFVPLLFMGLLAAPLPALAGSWYTYHSNRMAFSLRYPPSWRVTGPVTGPIVVAGPALSMNIQILPLRPAPSMRQTVSAVGRYDQALSRLRWTRTSLGGRPAMSSVLSPPTEGGVTLSDGVYISASRGHVYEVLFVTYHKPPTRRLARFPAVYGQILHTWRFL
ncbi:MAG: hypothetical protein ACR2JC_07455 [Chloroflexota bacterium]|nr:MAG: hypothetical protein DLM70_10150 [Chloroflexota bacterium]